MSPTRLAGRGDAEAWAATLLYLVLTLVLTWPLAAHLTSALPSDLADPALNAWALAWGGEHVRRLFVGDLGAFFTFWDANIFHPSPLALAYSEHLVAPSLQGAPLYALTRDPVLCHNLLLLASFVLAGLGSFLLVRDLAGPGHAPAALVGGLLYAFALYRFEQLPHLQMLSAHWMPLAMLGLRRFIVGGRLRPLVWGTLALVAQNLSCGYHLLYFPPFLAVFALFDMYRQGRLRSGRTWAGLLAAALFTLAATAPVLAPYAALRQLELTRRPLTEVELFSADVYSFLTAPESLRFWGPRLDLLPKSEGGLFLGVVPLLLAGSALTAAAGRSWRMARARPWSGRWRGGPLVAGAALLGAAGLLVAALLRTFAVQALVLGPVAMHLPALGRLLGWLVIAAAAAALLSPRFRGWLAELRGSLEVALFVGALLAAWLACGPTVRSLGREVGLASLYAPLYEHVPGFDGLRVPSRYMMVVTLFLSLLGGLGASELQRLGRAGRAALGLLALGFLGEAAVVPLPLNVSWGGEGVRPPTLVRVKADLPPVYEYVATLPQAAVLAELPIGLECWETRYMLCSTRHWRRMVNGYSGYSPGSYPDGILGRAHSDAEAALTAARRLGVTHLIVHEDAWWGPRGRGTTRRLREVGARELARFGSDVVLEVP